MVTLYRRFGGRKKNVDKQPLVTRKRAVSRDTGGRDESAPEAAAGAVM